MAHVFAAAEICIPLAPSAEECVKKTEQQKATLLDTRDERTLPDPLSLNDGWAGEKDGMESWPPLFLCNITIYLMADHPGKDATLHTRILNEYKEGKAYRLYTSGLLKEVFINAISPESRYCFLKAKCTHTMKISDVPHTSAYCSCTAG